jgi:hypothetical protein
VTRAPGRRFFAFAAAGVAAAAWLRNRSGRDEIEHLGGAWAGIGRGPGGREVEVALVIARRSNGGLLRGPRFELALRTRELVGEKPLERSTHGDDLLARAHVVARRSGGTVVVEARDLRVELDPAKTGELRLLGDRYWRAPELDLDVVLHRVVEGGAA